MDETAVAAALRTASPRIPARDQAALVPTLTRAWNGALHTHRQTPAPWQFGVQAAAAATYQMAHRSGAVAGHTFASGYLTREADRALAGLAAAGFTDTAAQRLLDTVADMAWSAAPPDLTGPEPTRTGRLDTVAGGRELDDATRLAAAADTGWAQGRADGHAAAAAATTDEVLAAATRTVGPDTVAGIRLDGVPAGQWLARLAARTCSSAEALELATGTPAAIAAAGTAAQAFARPPAPAPTPGPAARPADAPEPRGRTAWTRQR